MKINKRLIICFLACIITLLSGFIVYLSIQKYPSESSYTTAHIDLPQGMESAIENSQNEDGGFGEVLCISSDLRFALYSTYNAYNLIENIQGINENEKSNIHNLLNTIVNTKQLITDNSFDDVPMIFYFCKLCIISEYPISEEVKMKLVSYVTSMQSNEGFFYRSSKEKTEYLNHQTEYATKNPINSVTTYMALQIMNDFDSFSQIDISKLTNYFENELADLSLTKPDNKELSVLSFLLRCRDICISNQSGYKFLDQNVIDQYLNIWEESPSFEHNDINFISDLSAVYLFSSTSKDDKVKVHEHITNSLLLYFVSYEDEEMSIRVGADNMAIDVANALSLELNDQQWKNKIADIEKYRKYDNSYFFQVNISSNINTYFVHNILKTVNCEDKLLNKLDDYIINRLLCINDESPLSDVFTIRMALERKIALSDENVNYVLGLLSRISEVDYIKNYNQINEVISIVEILPEITVSDSEKERLYSQALEMVNYSHFDGEGFEYEVLDCIQKTSAYKTMYYLGKPAQVNDVIKYIENMKSTISLYSSTKEYDPSITVLLTWHLIKLQSLYNAKATLLYEDKVIIEEAISKIQDSNLYKYYNSRSPSWEITSYVVDIAVYFETLHIS